MEKGRNTNKVEKLVDNILKENMVNAERVGDKTILIKLGLWEELINIINSYGIQIRGFQKHIDRLVQEICEEKIINSMA